MLQQRLVETAPDDVPQQLAEVLRSFCASSPEVEKGYVCKVDETGLDGVNRGRLLFCVKLVVPVAEPGDAADVSMSLTGRFIAAHPDLMRQVGFGALADRAVQAWERYGVCLYSIDALG